MSKKLYQLGATDAVATPADFALQSGVPAEGYVSTLFSSANTSLFGLCRYPLRAVSASDKTTVNATEEFDATKTYAVGSYVTHNDGTATANYVCTTAVTTAGEWTGSTNWEARDGKTWTANDSTINTDTANAPVLIVPPAATGKARDFLCTVNTSDGVSVDFSTSDGTNTITYVAEDWDSIAAEDGINLFALTEVESNKFMIARKTVATKPVTA